MSNNADDDDNNNDNDYSTSNINKEGEWFETMHQPMLILPRPLFAATGQAGRDTAQRACAGLHGKTAHKLVCGPRRA